MKTCVRCYLVCLILVAVAACSPSRAPVVDYSRDSDSSSSGARVTQGVHEVRAGDTLYSIAWRYGWDFRALARANDIEPPYRIYPGDRIRLDAAADGGDEPASGSPSPPPSKTAASEQASATASEGDSGGADDPDSSSTAAGESGGDDTLVSGTPGWQWPAEGELVGRFGEDDMSGRGITLTGRAGAPVRAAARGRVVYRGNGLTGYGNLLIIKHNSQWLSAYAHNERMVVEEGSAVDAGERIATMGASGTYRTQLHFEIRRDGEPVDPEPLLPKR